MGLTRPRRTIALAVLFVAGLLLQPLTTSAQGLPRDRNLVRSGPQSLSGGSPGPISTFVPASADTVILSSGTVPQLLPAIPRLDLGFSYSFGRRFSSGQCSADYLWPAWSGPVGLFFLEAHSEYLGFWRSYFDSNSVRSTVTYGPDPQWDPSSGFPLTRDVITDTTQRTASLLNFAPDRLDVSVGGGYRQLINGNNFIGVNAFFDTSRIGTQWYPSWGMGVEAAGLFYGYMSYDLTCNHYGSRFSWGGLQSLFDRGPGTGFDLEGGVTVQLFPTWLDLRTKVNAYGFNSGEGVYGIKAGVDLSTRNGLFTLRLDHGIDRHLASYTTVAGFINVGLSLGDIFRGESPFTLPDALAAQPRLLTSLLTRKVERNWHQPAASVVTRTDIARSIGSEECLQLVATRTFTSTINWNGSSTAAVMPFVEGGLPPGDIPANNVMVLRVTATANDANQLLQVAAASNTTPVLFTRPTTPYVPVPVGGVSAYSVDVIAPFGLTAAGVTSVTGTVSAGKVTKLVGTIFVYRRLCPIQ